MCLNYVKTGCKSCFDMLSYVVLKTTCDSYEIVER